MTVKLICVGRLKEKFYGDACAEFKKRISRFADVNIIYNHFSIVCFQQIQHQSEESCFTGTVVSHQSEHVALIDFVVLYVYGNLLTEILFKFVNGNHDLPFLYS